MVSALRGLRPRTDWRTRGEVGVPLALDDAVPPCSLLLFRVRVDERGDVDDEGVVELTDFALPVRVSPDRLLDPMPPPVALELRPRFGLGTRRTGLRCFC